MRGSIGIKLERGGPSHLPVFYFYKFKGKGSRRDPFPYLYSNAFGTNALE